MILWPEIVCCDGLTGFSDAIDPTFPKTTVQLCIVHMVMNSLKFVLYKDYKEISKDLKLMYTPNSEDDALEGLAEFASKWRNKYPMIIQIWGRNWVGIIPFLAYPDYY